MKIFFLNIILILITILFLCEIDRNFMLLYDFKSYYFDNFPISILNGIHNSIYRFYENRILYNVNEFEFHNFLMLNKSNLLMDFNKNINDFNYEYAHNTTDILDFNKDYKYIRFKQYKFNYTYNLNSCQIIKTLLSKFNNIQTCFFSIMEKKITIKYHKGPYNGVLRYHFPLIVNNLDECYLEVINKKIKYDSPFIFDDTFPHQLVKKDDSYKVVLIIDVDNPYSYYFKHHKYI